MRHQKKRLFFLAALAVMTNGFSLLGFAHGSVGAVAKNIENKHNIGRSILAERTLQRLSGTPPFGRDSSFSAVFDMNSLAQLCSRLA